MLEVRTGDVRGAAKVVAGVEGVREVLAYGDRLNVLVDDAAARSGPVDAALSAAGILVLGIRTARPRMEEAYISLVRRTVSEGEGRR